MVKSKKIRQIFGFEPEKIKPKQNKLKISYNEKVFFNPAKDEIYNDPSISNLINNVINTANTGKNFRDTSSIKFNVNINNNYFNSNYNYVIKKEDSKKENEDEEQKGISGFFSNK